MIETLFLSALLLVAQPEATAPPHSAEPPQFSSEDKARLRCAAAFSIVAARAAPGSNGDDLAARGREFFVVTLADLMDAYQLDRDAISQAVRIEAETLLAAGQVDAIMPACLLMLQSEGL